MDPVLIMLFFVEKIPHMPKQTAECAVCYRRKKCIHSFLLNGVKHEVLTNQCMILHAKKKAAYYATSTQDVLLKSYTTIYSYIYRNASNL